MKKELKEFFKDMFPIPLMIFVFVMLILINSQKTLDRYFAIGAIMYAFLILEINQIKRKLGL